jgi:hypothetical protein
MEKNLYRLIAAARSSFAFPEGTGISYNSDAPGEIEPVVRIAVSTIWVNASPHSPTRLPMVLQIEADVWASDIDEAIKVADEILIGFADTFAVCVNAAVDVPQTLAIFDVTPDHRERTIREFARAPDYRGLLPVRCESTTDVDPALKALYLARQEYRIGLAMAHYKAALGTFGTSGLIFAFESLCIAAETLTEVFVKRELNLRSKPFSNSSIRALAKELGHYPPVDEKTNWRARLYDDIAVRRIFDADAELYKTVGKGTNGFEHGSMAADEIRLIATATVQPLFKKLRSAFFELTEIDFDPNGSPMSWDPVGLDPVREFIDATLRSPNDSFESFGTSAGHLPSLGITYEYASVDVVDGHLSVARAITLSPAIGKGVTIDQIRYGSSSPFNVANKAMVGPGDDTSDSSNMKAPS